MVTVDESFAAGASNWLIFTTNAGAKNFRLAALPTARAAEATGSAAWRDIIPGSKDIKLDAVDVFSSFWAVYGRQGGYQCIWLLQAADVEVRACWCRCSNDGRSWMSMGRLS